MLPFFFLPSSFVLSFLCFFFSLILAFPLSFPCTPSVLPSYHTEMKCCVMLSFSHKIKSIYPPCTFLSFPPSIPNLPSLSSLLSFLWPSSSFQTTGELLLKSTDRSVVKRNKRKDRFFLLKPQKFERGKKTEACHCTGGDHFLTINNTARWGSGREGWERKGREREWASTVPHHISIAICLLLFYSFFVFPALPLSVSFSLSCWS